MKELFKKIIAEYNGTITETENKIEISSNNEIACYYATGEIAKKKVEKCCVYLSCNASNHWYLGAEEKSYAILGGCFGISPNEENIIRLLEKYNFKKKIKEYTLFDLL